ncbi:MAG: isopentenyl phosphate kinase [Candidatus Hodarchaeota archaeon]
MKRKKEILILKLGGSLLTDKNKPFFIREEVAKSTIQQIINANEKVILIHGGGSFGHPLAKKYNISRGLDKSIPNQIFGLTETHQAMIKFNSYLINLFLEQNYPVLSIQPSSIFMTDAENITTKSIDIIETALDLNILPVLYGDIILDKLGSFSIISGDQIIFELCRNLQKYSVSKVIFAIEADGIFIKDRNSKDKDVRLASKIYSSELNDLDLADLGKKIDVTGGIEGKIDFIKQICKFNVPVQLINGLKENYIYNSLKNEKIISTNILTN